MDGFSLESVCSEEILILFLPFSLVEDVVFFVVVSSSFL